jgi:chaperonin GroEL
LLDGALAGGLIGQRTSLPKCAVCISDLALSTAEDVGKIIDAARQQGAASLLIVARKLDPAALATIMLNRNATFPIMAVQPPKATPDQRDQELADLALVTGARVFRRVRGDTFGSLAAGDLGRAREAWVSYTHTGFVSPLGDGVQVLERLRDLREQWQHEDEISGQQLARRRIARLGGRSAVLHVGGNTPQGVARKRTEAEQVARVIAAAYTGGAVPGGGIALLNCCRELTGATEVSRELEAGWARSLLVGALAAPVQQLAINAGLNPALAVNLESPPAPACILDPVVIIEASLRMAVSAATQALTIDHVVLHRNPPMATHP